MASRRAAPSFPLHLSEVLEEELGALRPADAAAPTDRAPWDFTVEQVRREGLPGLLARLRRPGDKVCARLRTMLSPQLRKQLERWGEDDGPDEESLCGALVEDLNRWLLDDELHRDLAAACRQDGVRLTPEMALLVKEPPADRRRLNRLLLEEALPGTFEPALDARLAAVYQRIHGQQGQPQGEPQELTALCLSGGGIRSAVFSLGVLQGLARRRLLHGFDYLSTVSGGGYVGGLLSAWIHRHLHGLDGVSDELAGARAVSRKLEPEPAPLGYLRNFSNYLSPKLGILSADSWTLVSIYVRNLFLHWLVFIPLLLAVLAVPRLYTALLWQSPIVGRALTLPWTTHPAFLLPDGLFVLGSLLMSAALGYVGWNRPSGGGRSTPRGFILFCLLPLTLAAVAMTIYWAWYRDLDRPLPGWWWFIGPAVAINLSGWSVHAIPAVVRGRVRPLAKLREVPFLIVAGTTGSVLVLVAARLLFAQPFAAGVLPAYTVFAVPCVLGSFVVGETVFAGLASRWTDDEDREWWSRSAAWMLIVIGVWTTVGGVVVYGPVLLAYWHWVLTPVGGLAGVATAVLARSSLTQGSPGKKTDRDGLPARVLDIALSAAAPIFVLILLSALSLGVSCLVAVWSLRPDASPDLRAALDAGLLAQTPVQLARWHLEVVAWASLPGIALLLLAALGIGLVMALLIDINKFSLHAMYRNRLIRTFLGASRENRRPNGFTGFDADDNLEIWRLRRPLFLRRQDLEPWAARLCLRLQTRERPPSEAIVERHLTAATRRALDGYRSPEAPPPDLVDALVADFNRMIRGRFDDELLRSLAVSKEERARLERAVSDDERWHLQRDLLLCAFKEEIAVSRPPQPLHVVNVALNLVGGKKLAWQQRKAESFTFSPLHCGSVRLGYRAAESYALGGLNRRAASLGTAMAVSGAAASPNMGYHSSPAITFLLTLFNARLGWWLGNPGAAGARTFDHAHPTLAVEPLVAEALGLTDDRSAYVYLSDGGHFENLGLYEMVLRRCRRIVVIDAGEDHECRFEDLGNAIRKIRIDLGIPIDLQRVPIYAEAPKDQPGRYCAVGEIHYHCVDGPQAEDGEILYIKPAVYGGEPRDVLDYKALNSTFPHESTRDQWFSESQFESYRMLGSFVVDEICKPATGEEEVADLAGLFTRARVNPPVA